MAAPFTITAGPWASHVAQFQKRWAFTGKRPKRGGILRKVIGGVRSFVAGTVGVFTWAYRATKWVVTKAAAGVRAVKTVLPWWGDLLLDIGVGYLMWTYLTPAPVKRWVGTLLKKTARTYAQWAAVPAGVGGAVGMARGTGMLKGMWSGFKWPLTGW